ncbi:MAG: orotate phosphoribosyltransferase [Candidatus ainarchaeum sp.]|nr:orotate phosphoribosyltransferase [Candidatus ainarchaeum sp.]
MAKGSSVQAEFRKNFLDFAGKRGTRLILAADDVGWRNVERVLRETRGQLAAVKIHPEHPQLWGLTHKDAVDRIKKLSGDAFVILDAKIADIDKSDEMKARYYFGNGYDALICHGFQGKAGVKAIVDVANELGKGVFLLAAMSSEGHLFTDATVERLLEIADDVQVAGVIAPGNQYGLTASIKAKAKDLLVLSPGIGAQGGDAAQAVLAGTDFAIVGRTIMNSQTPGAEAQVLVKAMMDAVEQRKGLARKRAVQPVFDERLLEVLVAKDALKFGDFTLKSGRKSTYFFNSGNLDSGRALYVLGMAFADAIVRGGLAERFDVVMGPAYKGIPLAACAVQALYEKYGVEKRFVFDRKEAKLYGDMKDKLIVGNLRDGDRVLLVDDVITTGGTKLEAVEKIAGSGVSAKITHILVLFNRQEKDLQGNDPVKELEAKGVSVASVLGAREAMAYLHNRAFGGKVLVNDALFAAFKAHQDEYGVK